jgi:UDP-glucose 4-epimerase
VNLGGYVDHTNKKKTFRSHYLGCKNLAEIFLKNPPLSFVQIGSCIEYGKNRSPQKESLKCNPKSIKSTYGKAKLLSSKYLMHLYRKKNFPSTVLRLYLAYGPRQDINRFLPIIITGCLKNKKFACSKGTQLRDFVHVEDIAEAIIKSLKSKNARGQIINIGSGKPRSIRSIIQNVKKISKGGQPQFGKIKLRKDEILNLYPNIIKAKNKINWKSKISFIDGLKSTIKYYEKQ